MNTEKEIEKIGRTFEKRTELLFEYIESVSKRICKKYKDLSDVETVFHLTQDKHCNAIFLIHLIKHKKVVRHSANYSHLIADESDFKEVKEFIKKAFASLNVQINKLEKKSEKQNEKRK